MRRSRLLLACGCVVLGFLAATVVGTRPADPAGRLSREYRLADLIERQQRSTAVLRRQVSSLRLQVEQIRIRRAGGEAEAAAREKELAELGLVAGLAPVTGPGVRVTLDDSVLDRAPTGNINDLVVHSQDVQAVVNALWKAGAEAVAINGQRLVSTSAVLCVGNTLLLNGTVHSPPYSVSAVGAVRDRFESDSLVRRLHDDATAYGLRFSVTRLDSIDVPAYRGATVLSYTAPRILREGAKRYRARVGARVLVVDNYDSFVYNLVQYLGELGAEPVVHRNDAISLDEAVALHADAVVVSPGPGRPADAGVSNPVIDRLGRDTPVLGVCLGHQCIGEVFGGRVVRAPRVMHGKTSMVHHRDVGVLAGLANPFEATRYHSLVVERSSLPDSLEVTAEADDGVIMGLRHRTLPIEGVQFHPESILTAEGRTLLANFLRAAGVSV